MKEVIIRLIRLIDVIFSYLTQWVTGKNIIKKITYSIFDTLIVGDIVKVISYGRPRP